MRALATDQDRWQRHIQQIRRQPQLSREEALRSLTVKSKPTLTWYTSASEPRATRRREPLATPVPVPEWRVVRTGELQATIPPPTQTLVPRALTTPGQALPPLPYAGVAHPYPPHVAATAKIAQASQRHHADGDGHGGTHPPQPVHP
jgi:hypothetical protein